MLPVRSKRGTLMLTVMTLTVTMTQIQLGVGLLFTTIRSSILLFKNRTIPTNLSFGTGNLTSTMRRQRVMNIILFQPKDSNNMSKRNKIKRRRVHQGHPRATRPVAIKANAMKKIRKRRSQQRFFRRYPVFKANRILEGSRFLQRNIHRHLAVTTPNFHYLKYPVQ